MAGTFPTRSHWPRPSFDAQLMANNDICSYAYWPFKNSEDTVLVSKLGVSSCLVTDVHRPPSKHVTRMCLKESVIVTDCSTVQIISIMYGNIFCSKNVVQVQSCVSYASSVFCRYFI